jgi:O-antigen ligase
MLLATTAVALALWWSPQEVLARFETVIDSPDISYHDRKLMTYDALRIARDHLAMGTGLGSFETVYPTYQSFATDYIIDYAHNDYAQLLAETGVAGAITACVACGLFLIELAHLQLPRGSMSTYLRLGAMVGCCGLLVHSWLDFNLHIPGNSAWFAFLAGLTQSGADL